MPANGALTDDARFAAIKRASENFEVFAAHCLKIRDKSGRIIPLILNRAQHHIHEKLEEQRARTGKVRALLLKGRQQGGSTLIGARFYHQCAMQGKSAFIVAHEDKATKNLFEMVKRFQTHNPLAPSTRASNAQELLFSALDCGYKLATAGTDDVGRSNTAQLLHGSEAAFWRNMERHMAGLGNTVADIDGTEIILESTANGVGGAFHGMWQQAEAGKSEYVAIFTPWFWQLEYRAEPRADLVLSDEDLKVMNTYGLDMAQMQWRANKIASYGDGFGWLVNQEFPNCPAEAFVSPTGNPLISPTDVQAAALSAYRDLSAPLIIGCDPAGDGVMDADRTAIAFRRGRVCMRIEYHKGLDTMQIAGKLMEYNRDMRPAMIFVDKGGLGAGVFDRLTELGAPVMGINSASKAADTERYENIRAEMWWRMTDWIKDAPVRIPNDSALISDLTAPQPKVSSNGRKLLEKKEDMAKRGIRSPDGADALALTFAMPVERPENLPLAPAQREAPTTAGY